APEDEKGAVAPEGGDAPAGEAPQPENGASSDTHVSYEPVTDASQAHDELYTYGETGVSVEAEPASAETSVPAVTKPAGGGTGGSAPPPPPSGPDDEDDGEGMLRMSFLEHLEELRKRLLYAIGGVGVAFALSLTFSNQLWLLVKAPAAAAL